MHSAHIFIKKGTPAQTFYCEFSKNKATYFVKHLPTVASVFSITKSHLIFINIPITLLLGIPPPLQRKLLTTFGVSIGEYPGKSL